MSYVTTPAEAIVDPLGGAGGDGSGAPWWRVTVRTARFWAGPKQRRVFLVKTFTDSLAASEGLRRFAEEVDGRPPIIVE